MSIFKNQNALGNQLSSKREIDNLHNDLDSSKRECIRLQCQLKTGKADRDIRITEMSSTIRVLSARSDIHTQLVQAKQEVESEKLLCNHLFHKECIKKWLNFKTTCPICRKKAVYYNNVKFKLYYHYY